MYEHQGINNMLFVALYVTVAMMATLAGVYLLATRGNAFTREVTTPPRLLRRWAAAFMAAVVGSHVWWAVPVEAWAWMLGTVPGDGDAAWMLGAVPGDGDAAGQKAVRDMACISLDLLTLVPLMMAWLLRLLQDRRRKVWPWLVAHLPVAVLAVVAVWRGDAGLLSGEGGRPGPMVMYQMALIAVFAACYVLALRRYKRWLLWNFADLEHKEVWQSLVVLAVIMAVYAVYMTNGGRSRYTEAMEGLWTAGLRTHPIFMNWRDQKVKSYKTALKTWSQHGVDPHPPRAPDIGEYLVSDGNGLLRFCPHDLHGFPVAAPPRLQGLCHKRRPERFREGADAGGLVVGHQAGLQPDGPESAEQFPAAGVRRGVRRYQGVVDVEDDPADPHFIKLLVGDLISIRVFFFREKWIHGINAFSSPDAPGASSAPA